MTAPTGQQQQSPTQLLDTLINKLESQNTKLDGNMQYYDAKSRPQAIGVSVPPEMRSLLAQIGWARMYVDSLEERLDLEGFRIAGQDKADEQLQQWWQSNNLDEQSGLGHIEAMIHGSAYITVSAPDTKADPTLDPSVPIIRVESPYSFYADFDPVTRRVTQAVRLYKDAEGQKAGATLMLPDQTMFFTSGQGGWTQSSNVAHGLGRVPAVPLVNREMLSVPFGASEITPEIRSATDAACRVMMNMQAAAELMAVPQRVLFGVSRDEIMSDPDDVSGNRAALDAYYARIMAFEEPGGSATQFSAAELRNFTEVLSELAKQVASYTGLPPQYLSFSAANPASAEAIKSSESRLVKKCERKTRMFGAAWEEAMRLAMLVMGQTVTPDAQRMETLWRDPSTPTYAAKADAVVKLYNSGAGVIPLERARIDMGYSPEEREEMAKWDQDNPMKQLSALMGTPNTDIPAPTADPSASGQDAAKQGTNVPGQQTGKSDGYGRPSRNGNK